VARAKAPAPPVNSRRTDRDWTARARGTAMDAIRYSHFVHLMKRALPIAAAAILAAVVVYSLLPRASDRVAIQAKTTGTIENDLAMIKPKLTGTDDDGNPYVITAEIAIQDIADIHRVHLQTVEADMTTKDGHWMNATAVRGFFDMDKGMLNLTDGIAFYSDSGYELHTSTLDVEMKKGLYHGRNPVTGHGPFGAMSGDRFEFDRLKQFLHVMGHVHTTILPSALRTHPK
jgi:lipopolysaccharide export system protein LptC